MTQDRGAFLSALDWLNSLSGPVKNVLRGNLAGAGRQTVDLLGDVVDAALPGDWIPHIAQPEDEVTPTDLLGIDRKANPWLAGATDFVGDVALNPSTYIPGTWIAKGIGAAGSGAAKAASLLPEAAQPLVSAVKNTGAEAGSLIRRIAGEQRITDATGAAVRQGAGSGDVVARANKPALEEIFKDAPKDIRVKAFQTINNSRKVGDTYVPIAEGTEQANPILGTIPQDTGAPSSDIARSQPRDDYLKIKAESESRGKIDPTDTSVGIEGFTIPRNPGDLLEHIFKNPERLEDQALNPIYANKAADKTLEQAYPFEPTDPRFKSGVDVANEPFVGKNGKTYGPDALKPSPSELGAPEAPLLKEGKLLTGLDSLTGAKMPKPPAPSMEVPANTLDRLNEMQGGTTAETKTVRGEDIPSEHGTFSTVESNLARWQKRIDASGWTDEEKKQVAALLAKFAPYSQSQYTEAVKLGGMYVPQGVDPVLYSPADYAHRNFSGLRTDTGDSLFGNASSMSDRSLGDKESLNAFRNANPNVKLEEDLGASALKRAGQQVRMAERADFGDTMINRFSKQFDEKTAPTTSPYDVPAPAPSAAEQLAKAVTSQGLKLNDTKYREAANAIIDHIGTTHPEDAQVMKTYFNGLNPQGKFLDFITKVTKPFKAAAVYGYAIPRFGSLFRNRLSGIPMAFANPETRSTTGAMLSRTLPDMLRAFNDSIMESFGAKRFTGDMMSKDIDAASEAFAKSGGVAENAMNSPLMPSRMKLALQHNVIGNTFINNEKMLGAFASSGLGRKWQEVATWPAEIQQGLEQRMRYGMFNDLLDANKPGMTVEKAAKEVESALYSYRMSSNENRLARTIIPFFQFQAKAVPQTTKLLAEKPYLATSLASAFSQNKDQPVYPWMQGKLNVPLGQDTAGNSQYITGFGLPFESLTNIPNPSANIGDFGRQFEQDAVAAANPLFKSAYSVVSGRDPYFGTEYGSYDNIAGLGKAGDLGQFYNKAAASGLIQPLDSILHTVGGTLDDRHSIPVRALDMLTGVNVASVDPQLALRQQLGQQIERNPDIQHSTVPYAKSADPDTVALLHEYRDAQKAVRDKRRAQGQLIP